MDQVLAIAAAISLIPVPPDPISLPPTPPAGYGADNDAIAAAVWAYSLASSGRAAGDQMDNAGNFGTNIGTLEVGLPSTKTADILATGVWWDEFGPASGASGPEFDMGHCGAYDDLVDFMNGESGWTGWEYNDSHHAWVSQGTFGGDWKWVTKLDLDEYLNLRAQILNAANQLTAPVWPGTDLVTTGDTYDIIPLLVITEPCDGVILHIDSVTTNKPEIPYGDQPAWRYLGALAFVNDIGKVEPWQPLAFADALYTVRSMKRASGVVLRADASIVGTVTPWVVT
jgi:hypothetical protein